MARAPQSPCHTPSWAVRSFFLDDPLPGDPLLLITHPLPFVKANLPRTTQLSLCLPRTSCWAPPRPLNTPALTHLTQHRSPTPVTTTPRPLLGLGPGGTESISSSSSGQCLSRHTLGRVRSTVPCPCKLPGTLALFSPAYTFTCFPSF